MNSVEVGKSKLLETLKENRDKHQERFKKALEDWKLVVTHELQKSVQMALEGKEFRTHLELPKPSNHTPEYDSIIDQVDWHEDSLIDLSVSEFENFVRDDWSWKQSFLSGCSTYAFASMPLK
ncbi:MAG: hypothetical protein FVQ80_06920 [Planctomycetes bacterium]|nr:hypothetical protein [Planctomycetota bacterium]